MRSLVGRRGFSVVAGALSLVFAPHCSGGAGGDAPLAVGGADASQGVVLASASWTLAWDRSGTSVEPGGGWSVTTDLGYRVHVTSGWLVDQSVAFGPCVVPEAGAWWAPRFGVRAAHAHGEDDPSTLSLSHVEDLVRAAEPAPWHALFAPTRYCRAHWLVARATPSAATHADPHAIGTSLRVVGSWSRGDEHGAVDVDTWWTNGRLADLAEITPGGLPSDDAPRVATVTVTRRLAPLFDGIDFATATELQVAWRVLDSVTTSSTLSISLAPYRGLGAPITTR